MFNQIDPKQLDFNPFGRIGLRSSNQEQQQSQHHDRQLGRCRCALE